jgi:hypothetical protein
VAPGHSFFIGNTSRWWSVGDWEAFMGVTSEWGVGSGTLNLMSMRQLPYQDKLPTTKITCGFGSPENVTTYIPCLIWSHAATFNLRKLIHLSFAAICPHSRRSSRRLIMHEVFVDSLIVPALLSLGYHGHYIRPPYDNKGRWSKHRGATMCKEKQGLPKVKKADLPDIGGGIQTHGSAARGSPL